jgi:hypothetical protein
MRAKTLSRHGVNLAASATSVCAVANQTPFIMLLA